MTIKWLLCISLLICFFWGCGSRGTNTPDPSIYSDQDKTGFLYDLSKPSQVWQLPKSLKEVSGNAWADTNHLLLIEDLHPDLYLVRLDKEGIIEKTIPLMQDGGDKFDMEDVALAGNTAYALWSHGVIYKIDDWAGKPSVHKWEIGLTKKNNTEGLCLDPVTHNLLIACKNSSGDAEEEKSTRAVYMFDLSSKKLITPPFLLIRKEDFSQKGYKISDFFPSAIAIHPQTHDLYILSTKQTKAMAVYRYDGQLKSLQYLNKKEMPQPEGICFSPKGDLFITSEGKHGEPPKILEFYPLK